VQGKLVGSRHKAYLLQRSATLGAAAGLVREFGDRLALVSFSEEGGHIRTGQYAQCDRVGRCELQRRLSHSAYINTTSVTSAGCPSIGI